MKKLSKILFNVLFLSFISMSLLINGCDDDDKDPIVGTWQLTKLEMNGDEVDPTDLGISVTVNFKDDGTYTGTGNFGEGPETINGTWEREDSDTVFIYEGTEKMTLTKEGEYYTMTQQESMGDTLVTMKMYFSKQ